MFSIKVEIFLRDRNGTNLEPRKGDNYEVGLKSEFFSGLLNTASALCEIKRDNLGIADAGPFVVNSKCHGEHQVDVLRRT